MSEQPDAELRFGAYLRQLRMKARISLRDFAKATGSDPGNISRLERGQLSPPRGRGILSRYAQGVGLQEGDDAWYRLFDLAAAEAGRIPPDLMDRTEVVEMLPAFFRTIRGRKPTEEDMRRLLRKLQDNM